MTALDYLHLGLEILGAVGAVCAVVSKLPFWPARVKAALEHAGSMFGKAAKALAAPPSDPKVGS